MSDERVATVRPVSEAEATGRVAEIFADIKATKQIDFVPRLWQVLATQPVQLRRHCESTRAIVSGASPVDRRLALTFGVATRGSATTSTSRSCPGSKRTAVPAGMLSRKPRALSRSNFSAPLVSKK